VPADLRAAVGKREEKISLKTKNPAEAKRRHATELAGVETRWANLRQPPRRIDLAELQSAIALAYERCLAATVDFPGMHFWDTTRAEEKWQTPKVASVGTEIAFFSASRV
jgi:hypothetical protein